GARYPGVQRATAAARYAPNVPDVARSLVRNVAVSRVSDAAFLLHQATAALPLHRRPPPLGRAHRKLRDGNVRSASWRPLRLSSSITTRCSPRRHVLVSGAVAQRRNAP